MKGKVYVFDMDGTLADSMPAVWGIMPLRFLEERNIAYPDDYLKNVIALGIPGLIAYTKEHFPVAETAEEMYAWFIQSGKTHYETTVPEKPFTTQTLLALKASGARLNILTGSPHVFLDPWVRRLGIEHLFDNLWSVDDFPMNKANPLLYEEIARRLGVKASDCVMVDDSIVPLSAAKQAGWLTVGIYDEVSKDKEREMREIADTYVHFLNELL